MLLDGFVVIYKDLMREMLRNTSVLDPEANIDTLFLFSFSFFNEV